MKIGFIGLGRMGHAMVLHLLEKGVDVAVYNRTAEKMDELQKEVQSSKFKVQSSGKLFITSEIADLVKKIDPPRIIWLMVPHGAPVDEMIEKLTVSGLTAGDTVIDGGNSFYKDSIRRYRMLKEKGINFLDVGTSGGIEGARQGACLMIGGEKQVYEALIPLFEEAACLDGYAYFGSAGAGHFVKMVHNGVEYGMLQAIGEGFAMLEKSLYGLDLKNVAENWTHGSVVRGWLMDLLARAFTKDPKLDSIAGVIGGGETGGWTRACAKELDVETPVIEASVMARENSLAKPTFSGKIVSALRQEFGQHEVKKASS